MTHFQAERCVLIEVYNKVCLTNLFSEFPSIQRDYHSFWGQHYSLKNLPPPPSSNFLHAEMLVRKGMAISLQLYVGGPACTQIPSRVCSVSKGEQAVHRILHVRYKQFLWCTMQCCQSQCVCLFVFCLCVCALLVEMFELSRPNRLISVANLLKYAHSPVGDLP